MEGSERDSTQDWLLPEHRVPPLVSELEERIEEALATARASEAAVMTVGAAALDAAEQARRAAELAERAAGSAARTRDPRVGAAGAARSASALQAEKPSQAGPPAGTLEDFDARADRLMERLQRIQLVPLGPPTSSAAAPPQSPH
jgi:hypothetical protein